MTLNSWQTSICFARAILTTLNPCSIDFSFCEPAQDNFTHFNSPKMLPVNSDLLSYQFWGQSGLLDLLLVAITLAGMAVITMIRHCDIPRTDIFLSSLCSETSQQCREKELVFSFLAPLILSLQFGFGDYLVTITDIHPVLAVLISEKACRRAWCSFFSCLLTLLDNRINLKRD